MTGRPAKDLAIPMSSKRTATFSIECLKDTPKAMTFEVKVPTPSERDTIGTRLFELGLSPVTDETIRATMIDELYKLDWGKGSPEANEAQADEYAELLDGYWSRQNVEDLSQNLWAEQEAQRVLDEAAGAPPQEPAAQPVKLIKIREHSQVKLLLDEIYARSPRLRKLSSSQMEYGRRNAEMMVRLHIISMTPADPKAFAKEEGAKEIVLERDDLGLITVEATDRLREFIGNEAWIEVVHGVDQHYFLKETERKNSDSPPGKLSDPTGSPGPSGDSENSGGESTSSSTGPAPTAESETITGK